ncbi:MAG: cytochrome c maturation protein CcmE [Chloroflexi bacterium]|nr:cytochrome c maturation protein CcmE [Chloroflexota bacterium]
MTELKARSKFIFGGAIIVLAVGYLIVSSIGGSTAYYLTVEEVKAQEPSERTVRVAGTVMGDTIEWNAQELLLKFRIADDSGSLAVIYNGPRPDMLRDGAEAVVEGRYTERGSFEANNLLLKCPSKYEEAATTTAEAPAK